MAIVVKREILNVRLHSGVGLKPTKLATTIKATYDDDVSIVYTVVGLGRDQEVFIDEEYCNDPEALSGHPMSFDRVIETLFASYFIEVCRD